MPAVALWRPLALSWRRRALASPIQPAPVQLSPSALLIVETATALLAINAMQLRPSAL